MIDDQKLYELLKDFDPAVGIDIRIALQGWGVLF